jgi:glycosyltransferase involved in cell wall biosynthesis
MKNKKFVSIIWGYIPHLQNLSAEENYHMHINQIAKELGYETFIIIRNDKDILKNDPNLDSKTKIIDYKNIVVFIFNIIKFSIQGSTFYINSYEWQSFIVPFLARRTIFMAHTQPKRQTVLKQKIQNFVYRFFSKIKLNNENERNFLISQGTPSKKLSVIPLPVSQNVFKLTNTNTNRKDLVYFGNITEKKNLVTIIKAFEIIHRERSNIQLHIIGNIFDQTIPEIIKKSIGSKNIILHNFLPNDVIAQELNTKLICINSSFDEGQCVAVYDAALCGCVLCLPNIMSFTGVFKDKALFHNVTDYQKLASNILSYLRDPDLVIKNRDAVIKMIRNEYSKETIEPKLKELILKA